MSCERWLVMELSFKMLLVFVELKGRLAWGRSQEQNPLVNLVSPGVVAKTHLISRLGSGKYPLGI